MTPLESALLAATTFLVGLLLGLVQRAVYVGMRPRGPAPSERPEIAPKPEEDPTYVAQQRQRILDKLVKDFPTIGGGTRERAADEILEKAKSVLGRLR